ncbi:hypothetical protein ILUMI_08582 [Ignelater luminosus]|uniref:Phenoloxidase-activating factor 2 n=1 Tax=Ignelater luminosus TaxID=2038154 RepID=A0A8K0D5F8_IGNLU|nr:hypothetical protein ILUMI_08582 [Ignelater luminosus]
MIGKDNTKAWVDAKFHFSQILVIFYIDLLFLLLFSFLAMRLLYHTITLLGFILIQSSIAEKKEWSWGQDSDDLLNGFKPLDNPLLQQDSDVAETTLLEQQGPLLNSTQDDQVIDSIIQFGRQGRNLDGYDEVFTDPNVKEAIQKGDDREARNVIKERLCSLGLMQCEGENVQGKRPYIAPEDLVYAQPVDIKPVGRPIPSIPVKRPHGGHYGPPRPISIPGPPGKYPPFSPHGPPRRGYGPPSKPFYPGKPVIGGPPSGGYFEESDGFLSKPPGPIYNQPIELDSPYGYEHASASHHKEFGHISSSFHKDKKPIEVVVNAQGGVAHASGSAGGQGVQQHVHHHFHHAGDGVKVPSSTGIKVPSLGVVGGHASIDTFGGSLVESQGSLFKPSSSGFISSSFGSGYKQLNAGETFNKINPGLTIGGTGFNGVNYGGQPLASYGSGLGNYGSVKPVVENYNPLTIGGGGSNSFGTSVGLYGNSGVYGSTNGLYKKELNLQSTGSGNSIQSNYLQSTYAGGYQGLESARAENYDCVCVPYNQCPSQDIIGRKDDLYLAIDPRNLKSDIEAIATEERIITDGNGTMTVVRVPKEAKDHTDKIEETRIETKDEKPEETKKLFKRDAAAQNSTQYQPRQAYYPGSFGKPNVCGPRHVCCKRPLRPHIPTPGLGQLRQCGTRHSQGINGRIKNPVYVDGDSEFGEYPWQVAILKKDPKESVYVCGGTLIDHLHIITAAHCVKSYSAFDLRVRLGEWDVNHDVEFYPYIERDISLVEVHPEFYAGTLYNDLALLRMDRPVDWNKHPHISPACLPNPREDYSGQRCWTTGWGKDAFGEFGKYQNILKEVDVPVIGFAQCQQQLQQTRLGYEFKLHPGFICAGGEEGKDACKGDGGGPMVCERGGTWQIVGVVSWGIGCGQHGVPGVYVKVAHYLDWIRQLTQRF